MSSHFAQAYPEHPAVEEDPGIYRLFFRVLTAVMLLNAFYWVLMAVLGVRESVSYTTIFIVSSAALLCRLFPEQAKRALRWALDHKPPVVMAMAAFQVLLLISTNLMVRSDAARVFNGAQWLIDDLAITMYISTNLNNLSLFLYERFFCKVFGENAVWALQAFHIFLVDIAVLPLVKSGERFFSKRVADIAFVFYVLLIGLTPQFMAIYTDPICLPFACAQIYFGLAAVNEGDLRKKALYAIAFGAMTAIGMMFRATLAIFVIALFIVLALRLEPRGCVAVLVGFTLGFAPIYLVQKRIEATQTEVEIIPGINRGVLAWLDIGLTAGDSVQAEFQRGLDLYVTERDPVTGYDGRYDRDVLLQDIKRRLREYTPASFIEHLLYKQGRLYSDGTLDWKYTADPNDQSDRFINPLYERLSDNRITWFIRSYFIEADGERYVHYRTWLQLVYIIVVAGLVPQTFRYRSDKLEHVLMLAVFGGVLFLLIFEGFKSRYLMQFMPQIMLCSALGYERLLKRWNGEQLEP